MIGIINFTHSDPLYGNIRNREGVVRETPADILRHILDGKLQGGMVSLVSLIRNGLELSRGANIHSISTTMSTMLVSAGKGMAQDMEIAVTSHTRTTIFYLEMVLKGLGIRYKLKQSSATAAGDLLTEADYALVIGDEALGVFNTDNRILLDTGFEFSRLYHLQPLYAAMAYRSGEDEPEGIAGINEAVHPGREIVGRCAAAAAKRLSLPVSLLTRYYGMIRYDFTPPLERTVEFVGKHLPKV